MKPSDTASAAGATPRVFSEAEYRANPGAVAAHALAHGSAIVERPDGTPRVVISIPPAETTSSKP